jgi:hypothetical protein
MSTQEGAASPPRRKDPLGKLVGRYGTNLKGFGLLFGAVVVAALGWRILPPKDAVARADVDDALPLVRTILGWSGIGLGALMVCFSPFYLGRSFEIRKRGVRYRRWGMRQELEWDDIDLIQVRKVTTVFVRGGRRSTYHVSFSAAEGSFNLGAMFLGSVNAYSLIQQLKLNSGQAFQSDDELSSEGSDTPRRKRRSRPAADEPTGDMAMFREARNRLNGGEPTTVVERWLIEQGVPSAAAAATIDKIVSQTARRKARSSDAPAETEEIQQARQQLKQGVSPDRVKRWLVDQGLSQQHAGAVVADLREQTL